MSDHARETSESDPSFLSALPARWRARAKELTSGPSLGPSRDLEYEMRAYQLEACADDLSSFLSALPRQEEGPSSWQPIATAPKDGTPFRVYAPSLVDLDFNPSGSSEAVYDPERIIAAKWDGDHDVWVTVFVDDATHWMPLPQSPLSAPCTETPMTQEERNERT